MAKYIVTYCDPDADYPAEYFDKEIEASSKQELWNKAVALGFVTKIFSCGSCSTLFSIHWNFNYLGLDHELLLKENYRGDY